MRLTILAGVLLSTSALAHHNQSLKTIDYPKVPGTEVYFSAEQSISNGVCKILGYEDGVPRSAISSTNYGYALIANSEGAITGSNSSHYFVKSITCINYTGASTYQHFEHLKNPTYPGTNTRYSGEVNNVAGVCKSLGFDSGLGYKRSTSYGPALSMKKNGDVREMRSNDYYISGVTCANKSYFTTNHTHLEQLPTLGYNFRDRAYQVAETVFNVAKTIEPYLNNDEERVIDELKKQAQRLKSRIEGQRKHTVVRNTLYTLEVQLADASIFIDRYLESDHLDGLAARLMSARESILGMVEYLDEDYDGKTSLY